MKLKNKRAIHIILIILIILLILFFILFLGKAFSKYKKDVNSNAVAEVATPIFVVDGTDNIKIDGIQDTVYSFSVKNYKGVDISEVDMNYTIQIVNNSEANLEFELTKNGEKVTLTNNTTDLMNLKGISRNADEFELKIIYNDNPAVVEDITGNVQIKVEASQTEVI